MGQRQITLISRAKSKGKRVRVQKLRWDTFQYYIVTFVYSIDTSLNPTRSPLDISTSLTHEPTRNDNPLHSPLTRSLKYLVMGH